MNNNCEKKNRSWFLNHPYQGMFYVPNLARNGERPRTRTNSSPKTVPRGDATSPPTNLYQSASTEKAGRRAWQRCCCNTRDAIKANQLEEEHYKTYGHVSGVWSQLQATIGQTSQGTWIGWTVISSQVRNSSDTIVSREREHVTKEGDHTEVETVGEGSDVSQGSGGEETAASLSGTEEKDDESAIVRKPPKMHNG
jgi:hypothetical protein